MPAGHSEDTDPGGATPPTTSVVPVRLLPRTALEALVGDWYWELDPEFRFSRVQNHTGVELEVAPEWLLGRRFWELGMELREAGGWPAFQHRLTALEPFRDVVTRWQQRDGTVRFITLSGVPMEDDSGGYRGVGRDITAQKQHEDSLEHFRCAIDASPDMVYLTNPETQQFVYVNNAACRNSGYSREELLERGPRDVLMATQEQLRKSYDETIAAGDAGTVTEMRAGGKGDRRTVVEIHRRAVQIDGQHMIVSISRDVSQRVLAERAVLRLTRMFAALSATNEAILRVRSPQELYQGVCDAAVHGGEFLNAAVILTSEDGRWLETQAAAGKLRKFYEGARAPTDASPDNGSIVAVGYWARQPTVSHDFLNDPRTAAWHGPARDAGIRSAAVVPLVRDEEIIGLLLLHSGDRHTFDDEVLKLLGRMADNIVFALERFDLEAERRQAEERAQFLATHDALTGLPNRVMFSQMLNLAIESARRYDRQFAVLFLDLDRFKVINDTLGHDAGDELLTQMSARLKRCLRASDVIARLGGDEFVVLAQEVTTTQQVATVARKLLSAAIQPVEVRGHDCRVTASIGISLFPGDAEDEKTLMKNADIAMYLAKEEGKNNFQFYSTEIKAQSLERLTIETELRRALERDELSLHYQAKLDLDRGGISGVEALLRWDNGELGSVTPNRFIPVAEESGLIVPIGRWVLRTACRQNMQWQGDGLPPLCIAVNLSPRQFADPDLLEDIRGALQESGMPAELLELEITESMVMHDTERAVELLNAIKAMGVRVAIDDFGTGYSSLSQLKRFPIDTLKVDRSFIRELPNDAEDRVITEAIIALGKSLSLTIVAEGVETREQQTYLRDHACNEMQGFYFSKPLAADDFADLVRQHAESNDAS